jgi:hypothetical protein
VIRLASGLSDHCQPAGGKRPWKPGELEWIRAARLDLDSRSRRGYEVDLMPWSLPEGHLLGRFIAPHGGPPPEFLGDEPFGELRGLLRRQGPIVIQ